MFLDSNMSRVALSVNENSEPSLLSSSALLLDTLKAGDGYPCVCLSQTHYAALLINRSSGSELLPAVNKELIRPQQGLVQLDEKSVPNTRSVRRTCRNFARRTFSIFSIAELRCC